MNDLDGHFFLLSGFLSAFVQCEPYASTTFQGDQTIRARWPVKMLTPNSLHRALMDLNGVSGE